jgi:DNA uptake protein ComE-like DNA-binding protein
MSLRTSLLAIVALTLGLAPVAPAHAQSSTTTTSTTKHTSSTSVVNPLKTSSAKTAPMKKVDLNTATKDQLMLLPGIGDAIADKIVANRPFANKHQLLDKGLVNTAQYAKMAPHIIASQASVAGAARTTTTIKHTKTSSVGTTK